MHESQAAPLFKGNDWKLNACVNFTSDMTYGYVTGYRRAGNILIDFVKEEQIYQDTLIYPVLFLFRHYVEIQLKELVVLAAEALNETLNDEDLQQLNYGHDLAWLWCRVKEAALTLEPESREYLNSADQIIDKLHELDPKSFSFRYSKNKKGDSHIDKKIRVLNFDAIQEDRERMFQILEGIKGGIGQRLALKECEEMESGLQEEMTSVFHEEQRVESEEA